MKDKEQEEATGSDLQYHYYAGIRKGRQDAFEEIEKIINKIFKLCKVCGGTHGEWIRKREFREELKKQLKEAEK